MSRQLLCDLFIGLATVRVCVLDCVYLLIRRVHQNFNFSRLLPFEWLICRCVINGLYTVRAQRILEIGWSRSLSLGISTLRSSKSKWLFKHREGQRKEDVSVHFSYSQGPFPSSEHWVEGDQYTWLLQNCYWGVFHKENVRCALIRIEAKRRGRKVEGHRHHSCPEKQKRTYRTVASREIIIN